MMYSLLLLLLQIVAFMPFSLSFNKTHILNDKGGENGMSERLSIVICSKKKRICFPKLEVAIGCLEYVNCQYPCERHGRCKLEKSKGHLCLRYHCKKVQLTVMVETLNNNNNNNK